MSLDIPPSPNTPERARQPLVDELCERDRLAGHVRSLLLRLEKDGHRLGWDHRDNYHDVFYVERNLDSGKLYHRPAVWLSNIIRLLCSRYEGNASRSYRELADIVEAAAAGRIDHRLPPAYRSPNMKRNPGPNGDLWPPHRPGWRFYGYGVRTEMWGLAEEGNPDYEQVTEARRVHQHAARIEARWVYFAGTDGLVWAVCRVRGHDPYVSVARPTDPPELLRGNLVRALGRVTNAVSGETVPLRPL